MKKQSNIFIIILLLFVFIFSGNLFAEVNKHKAIKDKKFNKSTVHNQFTMDGNNWAFEMTNYGSYAQDIVGRLSGGGAGGEFPKGTGCYVIFAAGVQVGALVDGIPKVSAIDFDSEYQPGALIKINPRDTNEFPIATNPASWVNKLYALRGDLTDGTPPGLNGDNIDDYATWPSQYGAPTRADGTPLVIGDLMSWCVYNDMDTSRHVIPDNSQQDPLGLEVQQASIQLKLTNFSNVFFMYYKIINKGTKHLSDVYIAGWFDPDVDNAGNDLIATDTVYVIPGTNDTVKNMVFTYNADNSDPISQGGSAFGADFFQGPVVPGLPTDTAKYLELTQDGFVQRVVPGKKVLGLKTTVRYINVRGPEGDPDNDAELYNLMRGREKNGDPRPNLFTYPADPLTAPGYLLDPRPDDKRMMLSTGPLNLAVGDTQVVILVCIGGQGTDRLNAIQNLRKTDVIAQQYYDQGFRYPKIRISTNSINPTITEVRPFVNLSDFAPATSVGLYLAPETGTGSSYYMSLYDDGLHYDSLAGDNIWGNSLQVENKKYPYKSDLIVQSGMVADTFPGIYSGITLRPNPRLTNWRVIWENGKQDKKINHQERVYLTFDIENIDAINDISNIMIHGYFNSTPLITDPILPSGTMSDSSIFLIEIAPLSGDSITFGYTIQFDNHSNAASTTLPVVAWTPGNQWGIALDVIPIVGTPDYLFPIVADPLLLTGHTYSVTFHLDTLPKETFWRLTDTTTGVIKINKAPIDVNPNYPHPIVDGIIWKIIAPEPGFTNFEVVANAGGQLNPPDGGAAGFIGFPCMTPTDLQQLGPARWLIHTADNGARASYSAFISRTTRDGGNWYEIIPYDFEMRFTSTGSWAWDCYYTGAYLQVPFELWNIGIGTPNDPSDDYRLIPILLDDDSSGTFNMGAPGTKAFGIYDHTVTGGENDPYTDWIYWYRPSNTSPGQAGYLAAEAEMIAGTYDAQNDTEVMARMVFVNWNGDIGITPPSGIYNQPLPEIGTIFRITTSKPNLPGDKLLVSAIPTGVFEVNIPLEFSLCQNYPNPFNPITTIAYQLPSYSKVTLTIYNILGQKIKTLVDEIQQEGNKMIQWNSTNNAGNVVVSGVYFYRLEATSVVDPGKSFTQVKKMILMK